MPVTTADRPLRDLPGQSRDQTTEPVVAEADQVRIRPELMELGQYYLVTFKGQPYLYRRMDDGIEVYGLAE